MRNGKSYKTYLDKSISKDIVTLYKYKLHLNTFLGLSILNLQPMILSLSVKLWRGFMQLASFGKKHFFVGFFHIIPPLIN